MNFTLDRIDQQAMEEMHVPATIVELEALMTDLEADPSVKVMGHSRHFEREQATSA